MKAFVLFIGLLTGIGKLEAQTNFGIAYYKVPEGWQVVQSLPNVILEGKRKDGTTCRIILSATEEVVIDKEESYRTYRQQKNNGDFSYTDTDPIVYKENQYNIAFISQATGTNKNTKLKSSFYSFTNRKATFYVQFISPYGNCEDAFSYFIKSLEIEDAIAVVAEPGTEKTKNKRTAKPRGRPRKNPA